MRETADADEPMPAILSTEVATDGPRRIRVDDEVEVLVSAREVTLRVVDIRDSFPAVDPDAAWVVIPLDALRAAIDDRAFTAAVIFLRAPGASATAVQEAMDEVLPATQVTGRDEVLEALRGRPLVRGGGSGFVFAVAIAIAYAALATTAALVLVAAVRSRETAHLRTMGMTPRDLLALSVIEHGPAVVTATIIGVALGVGVAWFVAPGLGLAGLIGSSTEVALAVEPQVVGLLLMALVGVLAFAIALSTWLGRRASLAGSARQGIE